MLAALPGIWRSGKTSISKEQGGDFVVWSSSPVGHDASSSGALWQVPTRREPESGRLVLSRVR
jgi:hypothetical protein